MINMCLASPPSAVYTVIRLSMFSLSWSEFMSDACLREQNETKKCKLHFLIASKQTKRATVEV